METKYDHIVNLLLNHWVIAILVLVAIILISLPQIRDGLMMILPSSEKDKKDDLIIEFADEKIVCEIVFRSYDFDIVKICATTHRLGIQAEKKWIDKFYPNYTHNMQLLNRIQTESGEKIFDIIPISNGTINKDIYFDITDFYPGAHVTSFCNVHGYAEKKIKDIYSKKANS